MVKMGFLVRRIQSYKRDKQWRKRNSHNYTMLGKVIGTPNIQVGRNSYGTLNVLNSSEYYRLIIGNYCSIAEGVTFVVCADHYTNTISTYPFKVMSLHLQANEAISKGDIVVDDDVWLGYGATILSGVHIGQGAVVAAGSVVTKDVPPYAIVGGVPAKVIKYRFEPDLIEELVQVDFSKVDCNLVEEHLDDLYTKLENKEQLMWLPRKDIK